LLVGRFFVNGGDFKVSHLNTPYGGKLINLIVDKNKTQSLKKQAAHYKSLDLTPRQVCDAEMLMHGAFSPLTGFMNKKDYTRVCQQMRLADGTLWPIPITLDVDEAFAKSLKKDETITLRNQEGVILATLKVSDIWQPDKSAEAQQVFGTTDTAHPSVDYLLNKAKSFYIGGTVTGIEAPAYYDFKELRYTPSELRAYFEKAGWTKVVAFQTRNPMHRAHVEAVLRAAKKASANVLIQPVVGMTKPGDVDHYTRVRVYKAVINNFPPSTAMIALLPLAMRMGGPREALWHAIIRKNYGVSHFIVGRDHAGPGKDSNGKDFYGPFEAMELATKHADEIGIHIIQAGLLSYVKTIDKYVESSELTSDMETWNISGTELRARLADGRELPDWFTYPEVAKELRRTYRARHEQGLTIFFTGLSGAGKSTIANALMVKLMEQGGRSVTLLDGDIVRKSLSSELGFSKEHRDLNVRRIGYVASEIAKHGGIAICAPIAPYDSVRKEVRTMVKEKTGGFILVHVSTPLEVCEARDRKGLYAAARAGKIKAFTGISDPYEEPGDADLVLDTQEFSPDELAHQTLLHLEKEGYLKAQS
jgi:sulfate adenylyltransferase